MMDSDKRKLNILTLFRAILAAVVSWGALSFAQSSTVPMAQKDAVHPWRQEDMRPGYVQEANPEDEETGEILYSIPNPNADRKDFQDEIFNEKLSKEFAQRYKEQFGRTEPEIVYSRTPYLNTNYTEGDSQTFDEKQYQEKQKKFGNFMAKRLVEFHVQNEAKTNPQLKAVNDIKEKVEKVDVSITPNFKLRAKYHISSNTARFSVVNPYADLSMRLEFSEENERVLTLQRDFEGSQLTTIIDYYFVRKRLDLIARMPLNDRTSFSLTFSPYREIEVSTGVYQTEKLIIGGIGYVF